jgi:molybdenum cofactor synthesis domain-containing protein
MSTMTPPERSGPPPAETVTAAVLVIGDEILSGRTKEKNSGTIADHLTAIGIALREIRVVADEEPEIIAALNVLRARYDYVFSTGGIGPTNDDITADAVARAFGVPIDIDPRALAMMRRRYGEQELTPARLRMARIPDGAELINNPVSHAPGFVIGNVIVMAGVPRIMEAMLAEVTPSLRTGARLSSLSVFVPAPEGATAPLLSETQNEYPDVKMGSYPQFENGRPSVHLMLRSADAARLDEACRALEARLEAAGLPHERDAAGG